MKKISYAGYRFPPEIIHQAIWLYLRFTLSFRDVEDLLAERGIAISYETIRRWVNHFGPDIAAELRKRRPRPHSIWHLDEVYLKIDGRMVYLWRAVDAEGEVLDVLVQSKRNKHAAGGVKVTAAKSTCSATPVLREAIYAARARHSAKAAERLCL
jgi:transposase-like protein